MPYIEQQRREVLDSAETPRPLNAGELNYLLTQTVLRHDCCDGCLDARVAGLCRDYITDHGLKYQFLNDVMGALDGATREFERRVPGSAIAFKAETVFGKTADRLYAAVAGPYEDSKIASNGDIPYEHA